MPYRKYGVSENHPWSRKPHNLFYFCSVFFVVAMRCANFTGRFVVAISAFICPQQSIFNKLNAFVAGFILPVIGFAINFYHCFDGGFFGDYTFALHK